MNTSRACVSVCVAIGLLAGTAHAATAVAWRSVREHSIGGVPLAIELDSTATGTASTSEPRRYGVQQIEVDFDTDVSGQLAGTVEAEDLTHGGTITATGQYTANGGTTLVVEFKFPNPAWPGSPPEFFGLADETCYRIDLAGRVAGLGGDTDCLFSVLAGNTNGDDRTNLADMAQVKLMNGQPLLDPGGQPIPGNMRFDVNLDGVINLADMAAVKLLNGLSVVCPTDPLPPPPPGMVLIPAGEFLMGDSFDPPDGSSDERPQHAVWVDAFYMDRYEVTNQQYADALNWAYAQGGHITVTSGVVYKYNAGTSYPYCDTTTSSSYSRITWNGSTFGVTTGKENHPMVMVSWYGSVACANWRSAMQGKPLCYDLSTWDCNWNNGYRLPTEAEWEKAARGGTPGHRFPWSDSDYIQHARANYYSSSGYSYDNSPTRGYHPDFDDGGYPYTSPVGSFAATGYGPGLYDMAGNAWEWCNDWYLSTYYSSSPYDNPHGPASGTYRVLRGGSWNYDAYACRVADRGGSWPGFRDYYFGFRCAAGTP